MVTLKELIMVKNTEEDIAIEEIVERPEPKKPEIVPVAQSKEAG